MSQATDKDPPAEGTRRTVEARYADKRRAFVGRAGARAGEGGAAVRSGVHGEGRRREQGGGEQQRRCEAAEGEHVVGGLSLAADGAAVGAEKGGQSTSITRRGCAGLAEGSPKR